MKDLVWHTIGKDGSITSSAKSATVKMVYVVDEGEMVGVDGDAEVVFSRSITATGATIYKVDGKEHTWDAYSKVLEEINIVTKARNFLVFQGDVEGLASKSSKDLFAHFEAFCGSGDYKYVPCVELPTHAPVSCHLLPFFSVGQGGVRAGGPRLDPGCGGVAPQAASTQGDGSRAQERKLPRAHARTHTSSIQLVHFATPPPPPPSSIPRSRARSRRQTSSAAPAKSATASESSRPYGASSTCRGACAQRRAATRPRTPSSQGLAHPRTPCRQRSPRPQRRSQRCGEGTWSWGAPLALLAPRRTSQ